MTREHAKQVLPIIQAYAEGKTIQLHTNNGWMDLKNYDYNFELDASEYRIKPEPREFWYLEYIDNSNSYHMYSLKDAEDKASDNFRGWGYKPKIIHVREVID